MNKTFLRSLHIMIHPFMHPHRIHLLLFKFIFVFILTCIQVQFKGSSRKVVASILSNRLSKLQTLKVPVQIKKYMFKQQMQSVSQNLGQYESQTLKYESQTLKYLSNIENEQKKVLFIQNMWIVSFPVIWNIRESISWNFQSSSADLQLEVAVPG